MLLSSVINNLSVNMLNRKVSFASSDRRQRELLAVNLHRQVEEIRKTMKNKNKENKQNITTNRTVADIAAEVSMAMQREEIELG